LAQGFLSQGQTPQHHPDEGPQEAGRHQEKPQTPSRARDRGGVEAQVGTA